MAPTLSQFNILIPDAGSAAAPTLAFQNSSLSGFFLKADSTIGVAVGGTEVFNFSPTGGTEVGELIIADGTAAAPGLGFAGASTNTGLYLAAADSLGFSANGTICGSYSSSGVWTFPNQTILSATSNQLVVKPGANKFTITAANPAADRVLTIPDPSGAANFILSAGTQTVAGSTTFTLGVPISAVTNQLVLGTTNTVTISAVAPAASRVYSIQDAGGAADFVMTAGAQTIAGAKTFSSAIIPSAGVTGSATNDSAAAGIVGEYITAQLGGGSATSLTTNTAKTIISIALTAGDWDVAGAVHFSPAASTAITDLQVASSLTTNAIPAAIGVPTSNELAIEVGTAANVAANLVGVSIPAYRISLAAPATVFLTAKAVFSVSTMTGYGFIGARRAR